MLSWTKIKTIVTRPQHSISSASLILAITFGASAILGFLRSRFLYARFFQCCVLDLDAYNAAFRLPDLIFKLLVTGALSASFIPVFASYLHHKPKEADRLASSVINLLFFIFLIAAIIILIFTRPLSELIATGFNQYQIDLMVNMTRILLVAQIFFLLSNFITGILQVKQHFLIPSLAPIVYNIFIILSIFTLVPAFGIYGPVYGAVVGAFFHLAIQIPLVRRQGFKYLPVANFHHSGVKEIFHLMLPRSISLGLGEIENTVTLFFASTLTAGSISLLNLSLQLMYLPSRIFSTTIGQASLPILSKNIAKNQLELFRDTVKKTIVRSLYLALPVTTLILVNRVAIVRLAFGAKQFPWTATLLTAKTLAYLTPAIVAQAVVQILVRSFYALHDTKTPLKVSAFSLVVNVLTSYFFVRFTNWGILGLAISASLSNVVQCVGLWFIFIRRVDGSDWLHTFGRLGLITFIATLSSYISWLSLQILDRFIFDTAHTFSVALVLGLSTLAGLISFILFSYLFRVPELFEYKSILHRISSLFSGR